jgi:hypothetical protein
MGLTDAELKLLHAAPKGELAVCGPTDTKDPASHPSTAEAWGREREIRAELIRWLCLERDASSRVDPRGIRVHAAKVTGVLDVSSVAVPFPLTLFRCRLTHDADLTSIQVPHLNLGGSWVRAIQADSASVKGGVFLRDRFHA